MFVCSLLASVCEHGWTMDERWMRLWKAWRSYLGAPGRRFSSVLSAAAAFDAVAPEDLDCGAVAAAAVVGVVPTQRRRKGGAQRCCCLWHAVRLGCKCCGGGPSDGLARGWWSWGWRGRLLPRRRGEWRGNKLVHSNKYAVRLLRCMCHWGASEWKPGKHLWPNQKGWQVVQWSFQRNALLILNSVTVTYPELIRPFIPVMTHSFDQKVMAIKAKARKCRLRSLEIYERR